MKRAWFQRIRGGGCQTLVYGGKTHVLPPFLVNLSIVLLLFGGEVNGWVVEAVIAFGGGCGRTVSPFPTCPLHPRMPIILPHAPMPPFSPCRFVFLAQRSVLFFSCTSRGLSWLFVGRCSHFCWPRPSPSREESGSLSRCLMLIRA